MLQWLKANATILALIVIGIILAFLSPDFFTPRNLSNLTRQVTIIGILAVGMTYVILMSGIDLSIGSIVGLSAIVVTMLMQAHLSVGLSIFLTLVLCGVGIGLWNGFWIARYRIPPFIITLGMMTIARGFALTLSNGSSVPVTDSFFSTLGGEYFPVWVTFALMAATFLVIGGATWNEVRQRRLYSLPLRPWALAGRAVAQLVGAGFFLGVYYLYLGIPVPVGIFAVIALLGTITLQRTKFGRRVYAIGGNEEAARLSGINVFRTKLLVYSGMSTLAALSGIVLASRLNGASPNLGTSFELDTIAAVVIGGTSLSGGVGTIGGAVIGTLLIGMLDNGMSLLGVNSFYQLIAKGAIIIVAVWFDVVSKRRKA